MRDCKILLVTESCSGRALIKDELGAGGYRVDELAEGVETLVFIRELDYPPDLIILEIELADMDGLELCRKLNGEHGRIRGRIPVLLLTDRDVDLDKDYRARLGVAGIIKRPFVVGDVRKVVDSLLRAEESFEGMRALIAEDAPVVRKIVKRALERIGLKVVEVADGIEAIDVIENPGETFDIVITDYKMPNMLGDEFCRRVRRYRKMENVPIFFISSADEMEAVIGFFRAGASDYLKKPFSVEELRARVVTHLRVRKYVREMQALNEKLHNLATMDELTGVYNRRFFQENLKILFRSSRNSNRELCCLLLDLDKFKDVNDNLGHVFGDHVLREFGRLLRKNCRSEDIVARYGGEEFIVLMPQTTLQAASTEAEKLRIVVEGNTYDHAGSSVRITCSIGLASLSDHKPQSGERLTSMADSALYRAKTAGRNRVEIYTAECFE